MNKNLIFLIILITAISAKGQQDPVNKIVYFQNIDDLEVINNPAMINPTFLGDENKLILKFNFYEDLSGFESDPTKYSESAQAKLSSISIGLNFDIKEFGYSSGRWLPSSIKKN